MSAGLLALRTPCCKPNTRADLALITEQARAMHATDEVFQLTQFVE